MGQQNTNLKFRNGIDEHNVDNTINPQYNREKLKKKIMLKYGISEDESERILLKLEKREKISKNSQNKHTSISKNKFHNPVSNFEEATISNSSKKVKHSNLKPQTQVNAQNNVINDNLDEKSVKQFNEISSKNVQNSHDSKDYISYNTSFDLNGNNTNDNFNLEKDKSAKDVDVILDGILPDYNQQISIELDNVNLTFEIQNEKVDTLKETFIRSLKRKKSKKIKIHALNDVSFKIYKGEKVGIIGYNGAGKSTLLNVITGIYPPDKGNVTTYGNISPLLSLGAGFDYNFSGRKNIFLNGSVLGYDKEYLESKLDEIIEFSELGDLIDIPIKNYSSGMLAKLGFSIATAVNPDILIIDEILGVGDVNFMKKSADKIKSLMDGGTTVLLVSHSIPQIRELCDKAIWMDGGSVRDIGEVNVVCDNYLKDAEKASNEQLANIQFK